MTLDQLNYLLVLMEEQSVTRAAERLYITQPTLTAFINKQEKELGTKLFDRSKNPVRVTPHGELYIQKMQEILLSEQQLKEELRYQSSGKERIRIGLGYAHSATWGARLSELLLQNHPALDIRLREGQEADLLSALRSGDIEVFFGHAEVDRSRFHFDVLFDERILLLLPRCFLVDAPEKPDPCDPCLIDAKLLSDKRMIIPGNSMGLNLNVQLLWQQYDIHPDALVQTNNTLSGVQMVAKGLGYMLGNEELVRFLLPEEKDDVIYCLLPGMPSSRKYYYGYAESSPHLGLIKEAVELLRSIALKG